MISHRPVWEALTIGVADDVGFRVGFPQNPVTPRRHVGPDLKQGEASIAAVRAMSAQCEPHPELIRPHSFIPDPSTHIPP